MFKCYGLCRAYHKNLYELCTVLHSLWTKFYSPSSSLSSKPKMTKPTIGSTLKLWTSSDAQRPTDIDHERWVDKVMDIYTAHDPPSVSAFKVAVKGSPCSRCTALDEPNRQYLHRREKPNCQYQTHAKGSCPHM